MWLIIRKLEQQFAKRFLTSLMAILICFVLLIVSGYRMPIHSASSDLKIAQQIDLGQSFRDLGVDGSIVIYDQNNARFYEHNPSRNTTAFLPASTFKIFNALVSLETGVIPDDVAVLTWDGIKP